MLNLFPFYKHKFRLLLAELYKYLQKLCFSASNFLWYYYDINTMGNKQDGGLWGDMWLLLKPQNC